MDVLEIAKKRRSALEREIAKLSEFIEMGEALTSNGNLDPGSAGTEKGSAEAAGGGPNTIRQFSSGNAGKRE